MRKRNKLVYDVGINDADYAVYSTVIVEGRKVKLCCPYYVKWCSMLCRCYSEAYQAKQATYVGCSVCEEWKYFMAFRAWMIEQDGIGKHLDKDLLIAGNKEYSPKSCLLVTQQLNNLLSDHAATRGDTPIGVHYFKRDGNFQSYINVNGKREHLGYFSTPELAHLEWQKAKLKLIKLEIGKHGNPLIDKALHQRVTALERDIEQGVITIKP